MGEILFGGFFVGLFTPTRGIRLWWGISEVMWGVVACGVGVCLYPWSFNEWILARVWSLLLIAADTSYIAVFCCVVKHLMQF